MEGEVIIPSKESSYSNRWFKLFQHLLWVVSNYTLAYAMRLSPISENSLGINEESNEKYIGKNGRFLLSRRIWEDWVLKILWNLTKWCWLDKAKYFPRGTIFDAKASSGSYAWQSILKAKKVIDVRLVWRLGNGNSIQIYNDRWIPITNSAKIISPWVVVLEDAVVANLLDQDWRGWNRNWLAFLAFQNPTYKGNTNLCYWSAGLDYVD